MSDYERVTLRQGEPKIVSKRVYYRLRELEDKIENGTLIELPCKEGDKVYYETFVKGESVGVKPHKVIGFVLEAVTADTSGFWGTSVRIKDFGESVFLTKEEAEKKLEELRANK